MFKRITTTDGQLRRLDDVATSTTIKKKRKLFGGKIFLKENLIRLPHLCARPSFLTSTLAVFYYLFSNISTYLARHFETTIVATSKQHKKSSDAEKIAWDFLLMVICFFLSVFGRKSASTSSTSSSSYFFFYKEKVPIVLYFFFPLLFEFMALFVFQSTVPLCTFYSHWNDELLAEDLGRVTDAGHTVRRQHVVRQSFSLCILLTANDWCVCVCKGEKKTKCRHCDSPWWTSWLVDTQLFSITAVCSRYSFQLDPLMSDRKQTKEFRQLHWLNDFPHNLQNIPDLGLIVFLVLKMISCFEIATSKKGRAPVLRFGLRHFFFKNLKTRQTSMERNSIGDWTIDQIIPFFF